MRLTVIGLFILLQTAPLNPNKVAPSADHATQSKAEQQSPAGTATNVYQGNPDQTPAAKESAKEQRKYERWGLWVSFISALATVALAVYSAIQARAARDMAKSVQGQAITMDETLKAIGRQADAMERQEKILIDSVAAARDNAEAAKNSAEAASDTVKVMKSKESGRLVIEPEHLSFSPSAIAHTVRYSVRFYGLNDLIVLDSRAEVQVSETNEFSDHLISPRMIGLGDVIEAQKPRFDLGASFEVDRLRVLTDVEISAIHKGDLRVRFTGFLRYLDVFGDKKELLFDYRWKATPMKNLDGTPYGYWEEVKG